MNLIVNLLSDQTIPNVQFIKEFHQTGDDMLFISTPYVLKKGVKEWILNACSDFTFGHIHTLLVNPYDIKKSKDVLEQFNYSKYDEILVNVTGGTKMMSLSAFDFFKSKNAIIYYLTGREGQYFKIFPIEDSNYEHKIENHISLLEYLTAYGYDIVPTSTSGVEEAYTQQFFKWFIQDKTPPQTNILLQLQNNKYRKRGVKIHSIEGLDSLLMDINFPTNDEKLSKYHVKYLTGEWFEEYIYNGVKKELNLGDNLMTGVNLIKNDVNNEYDVVFLYKEKLHLIECKTFIINNSHKNLISETIYKSSTLKRQLGLFAQSYIFTLNKIEELNDASLNRAKEYNIKIVGFDSLQLPFSQILL